MKCVVHGRREDVAVLYEEPIGRIQHKTIPKNCWRTKLETELRGDTLRVQGFAPRVLATKVARERRSLSCGRAESTVAEIVQRKWRVLFTCFAHGCR